MVGANLVEIFSSFQGEGPHVGASTLFVRFGECDLRCRWCDSPHTWKPSARCRIEDPARGEREIANPVPLAEVAAAAEALDLSHHRFVSLTGGEPLLQPEAVRAIAEALRAQVSRSEPKASEDQRRGRGSCSRRTGSPRRRSSARSTRSTSCRWTGSSQAR